MLTPLKTSPPSDVMCKVTGSVLTLAAATIQRWSSVASDLLIILIDRVSRSRCRTVPDAHCVSTLGRISRRDALSFVDGQRSNGHESDLLEPATLVPSESHCPRVPNRITGPGRVDPGGGVLLCGCIPVHDLNLVVGLREPVSSKWTTDPRRDKAGQPFADDQWQVVAGSHCS